MRQGDISRASFEKSPVDIRFARRPETDRAETTRGRTPGIATRAHHQGRPSKQTHVAPRRELDRVPRGRVRKHGAPSHGGGEIRRAYDCRREPHQTRFRRARVHRGRRRDPSSCPPTRSILAANRRLAELPCGGGTPLAHGLVVAGRVAVNAAKTKGGASDARVVLITDGGANVGLDRSLQTSSERCPPEAYVPSKAALRGRGGGRGEAFGTRGVRLLVVDTESPFAGGERMDAARSNLAKDARARRAGSITGCRWSRTRARAERRSSLASG